MTKKKTLTRLVNFVCAPEEYEHWQALAKAQGLSWGEFARRAVRSYAGELPEPTVLAVQKVAQRKRENVVRQEAKKERVEVSNLLKAAKQAPVECDNRLPSGAFCKRCGRIHK